MNDLNEEPTSVTRSLIPEDQRLSHTANLFGAPFPLMIEPVIYGITERMRPLAGSVPSTTTCCGITCTSIRRWRQYWGRLIRAPSPINQL
jgi:hypothetical protein